MPYIGNNLATQFQAFATQTITGDGSTGYTLDRAVANGKELLVYINNVKQEEGSGKSYTASGTTITFSEAVASGDSCYLVYMGSAQQTVTAPDASIVSGQLANANLEMPNTLDMNGKELILDADADTSITADTDDQIDIKIAGSDVYQITATKIDLNGKELVLDADADTSITADTDDQIDIKLGGSDSYHFKATAAHGNGIGIGTNAPLRQLHIENTSANSEIAFTAGTSGVSSILFGDGQTGTDVYRGFVQYNHSTDKMLFGTSSNERMSLNSVGSLNCVAVYNDTTSGAANVNVVSDGHLRRSTSSRKYKNTINDATHGLDDLLKLRSVTYKGNNDGDTIFGGLIAEEVHDAGLTEFVQYDDDNKPDALAYGNMVALCVKAIQELKTELDDAKARITELENA